MAYRKTTINSMFARISSCPRIGWTGKIFFAIETNIYNVCVKKEVK